jgi:hypothetical protein
MTKLLLFASLFLATSLSAQPQPNRTHGPDCSGGWTTEVTLALLKNAGLVNVKELDFSKTTTVRLASERIGKDLWHQVYRVRYVRNSGEAIQAIAIHDASQGECSMTAPEVFVVADHLGQTEPKPATRDR